MPRQRTQHEEAWARGNGHGARQVYMMGQNIWGQLARGSTASCRVATTCFKDAPGYNVLSPRCWHDDVVDPNIGDTPVASASTVVCAPQAVPMTLRGRPRNFTKPEVALGATWTLILDDGELHSAGWAGDGACGFAPSVDTNGMCGEHLIALEKARSRWPGSHGLARGHPSQAARSIVRSDARLEASFERELAGCPLGRFRGASAAYTSSLFLSEDRRCVFTAGLELDAPTKSYAFPPALTARGKLRMPAPVFVASDDMPLVRAVVATYTANFIVLEDGRVLRTASGPRGSSTASSWEELPLPVGVRVRKMVGNGWSHFGALSEDGRYFAWTPSTLPAQVLAGVRDFSLGSDHTLVIKSDGSLWSSGASTCGRLGLNLGGSGGPGAGFARVGRRRDWKAACAGMFFSMALTLSGEVFLWGSLDATGMDACDQGVASFLPEPTLVEDYFQLATTPWGRGRVESIACGLYHAAVVVEP